MVHNELEQELIKRMQKRLLKQQEDTVREVSENFYKDPITDLFGELSKDNIKCPYGSDDLWYKDAMMKEYGVVCYKKQWLEEKMRNGVEDWKKLYYLFEKLM